MMKRALTTIAIGSVIASLLSGCIGVGQATIVNGRQSYNESIRDTSNEQLMLNIVRASFDETPQFSDVTNIGASATTQFGVMSSVSGIGLAGQRAGLAEGSAGYTENPVITIVPLRGQALISQVS